MDAPIRRQENDSGTWYARSCLMDDVLFLNFSEIKLAGLEALVLEELETHLVNTLVWKSMTNVEAMVGLRIRDSKPSEPGSRGQLRWLLLQEAQAKHKDHRVPKTGVSSAVETVFSEIAFHVTPRRGRQTEQVMVHAGKGKSKDGEGQGDGQSKGQFKCTKCHRFVHR